MPKLAFAQGQHAILARSLNPDNIGHKVTILDLGPWKRGSWVRGQVIYDDVDYFVWDENTSKFGFVTETQLKEAP